jgi:hypothetical protein
MPLNKRFSQFHHKKGVCLKLFWHKSQKFSTYCQDQGSSTKTLKKLLVVAKTVCGKDSWSFRVNFNSAIEAKNWAGMLYRNFLFYLDNFGVPFNSSQSVTQGLIVRAENLTIHRRLLEV